MRIKNFREMLFTLDGVKATLAGMSHPNRQDYPLEEVLKYICEIGYTTLISLDQDYEDIKRVFEGISPQNTHIAIVVEDFTAPSIKQFIEFKDIIVQQANNDRKAAVHCIAGNGRTGTMLASVALYELLQKEIFNCDEDKTTYKLNMPRDKDPALVSKQVEQAVNKVRGIAGGEHSVEVISQAESLLAWEQYLLNEHNR